MSRVDDYAWLARSEDPQTVDHLHAEQSFYDREIARLAPIRVALEAEMAGRLPAADASVAWRRSGVVYFTRSRRGEEHERLYRLDHDGTAERLVLDPNSLDPNSLDPNRTDPNRTDPNSLGVSSGPTSLDADGVPRGGLAPLTLVEPSPDGYVVAYGVSGPDGIPEIRFRDVETGLDLPDRLPGAGTTGAWGADSRSFLYARSDGRRGHEVLRHVLGTASGQDRTVLTEPDARFDLRVHASRDGAWIVLTSASADCSEVHLVPSGRTGETPRLVTPRRPGVRYDVEPLPGGWDGLGEDTLLLVTDDGAPEFRLVEAPVPPAGGTGDARRWEPVAGLPGSSAERLEFVVVMVRHVVLGVRRDAEPFLRIVDRPAPGTGLAARPATREVHPGVPYGRLRLWHPDDPGTGSVVIVEENLVTAPAWVEIDLATGARSVVKRTPLAGVDPTRYVTDRLSARAADGVAVPVTIARRRDARRGRTAGMVVTAFGAFEECTWPAFDPATLSLLDRDLVVAVAHVRGGGELGRGWWSAARGRHKARSFVDLFAVRDALVAAGWAGEVRGGARVVVRGASAGGQLAAAVYSRAPRMWRAVVAETPLVDPVTTLSDPSRPPSPGLVEEWGDPLTSPADLAAMLAWSPYDNPPPPGRPPLLVTASRSDARHPLHEAARWVARLRATDQSRTPSPVLLRIDSGTGERTLPGMGSARMRYEAEVLAWVLDQLGLA